MCFFYSLKFIEDALTYSRTVHGNTRISTLHIGTSTHNCTNVPSHTYSYLHALTLTRTHTCMYLHPHTFAFLHFHTCTHSHTHKHSSSTVSYTLSHSFALSHRLHVHLRIYKRTLVLASIPIHTGTHAHTYIRSHTQYCTLVHSHACTFLWVTTLCLLALHMYLWVTSLSCGLPYSVFYLLICIYKTPSITLLCLLET